MDYMMVFFSVAGSAASIAGLFLQFRKRNVRSPVTLLLALILILTGVASWQTYAYQKAYSKESILKARKDEVRKRAKTIANEFGFGYMESGRSLGLLYSTLILLEENSDLYPESFKSFKEYYHTKVQQSNQMEGYLKDNAMEEGGKAAQEIFEKSWTLTYLKFGSP